MLPGMVLAQVSKHTITNRRIGWARVPLNRCYGHGHSSSVAEGVLALWKWGLHNICLKSQKTELLLWYWLSLRSCWNWWARSQLQSCSSQQRPKILWVHFFSYPSHCHFLLSRVFRDPQTMYGQTFIWYLAMMATTLCSALYHYTDIQSFWIREQLSCKPESCLWMFNKDLAFSICYWRHAVSKQPASEIIRQMTNKNMTWLDKNMQQNRRASLGIEALAAFFLSFLLWVHQTSLDEQQALSFLPA